MDGDAGSLTSTHLMYSSGYKPKDRQSTSLCKVRKVTSELITSMLFPPSPFM